MRCRACNAHLSGFDLSIKQPDGSDGELCKDCRYVVHTADLISTKEFQFERLTENPLEWIKYAEIGLILDD